ncbi:MAG: hypothetical protein ACP5H3_03355, partial [Candidatus Aenigmatarchaeota archaeon]
YQLSVEHNSTISHLGILKNISVLVNFTSTLNDNYTMAIYDFNNSRWDFSACQNVSATANIYYAIWCNVTINSTNYVSNDGKVRVRLNSTIDNDRATLKEEYVQFYIGYEAGILEVHLDFPDSSTTFYITQNSTFWVNASVICRDADCSQVNATVLYNLTSLYPDTPVNGTYGDKPFFINETPAYSTKICSSNLLKDQSCNVSWLINATGNIYTVWKVGVVFNSSIYGSKSNSTDNATIKILPCTIDYSLTWNSIDFGILNPSTKANPAPGNNNYSYNISISPKSCNLDFYIRGDDLYNSQTKSYIKISNMTVSNSTNSYFSSFRILNSYQLLFFNITNGNYTTFYWLDVPPTYAGTYTATIYIAGVLSGELP